MSTSEQYFELLNKLVGDSCDGIEGGNPSNFGELLHQLIKMIKQHPIVEVIFFSFSVLTF